MTYAQIAVTKYREGGREALIEWIGAADSGPERHARKTASFMWLYGCGQFAGVIE